MDGLDDRRRNDDPVTKRVVKVLDECFQGSVTCFADAMGVDRSTASRYKSGAVVPSRRSLRLLSQETGVSLDWLERGAGGEQIVYDCQSSLTALVEGSLPLFRRFLTKPPGETTEGRPTMAMSAPVPYIEPNRYWYGVPTDCPDMALKAGDRVMLEVLPDPQPVQESDVGRLFVVETNGRLALICVAEHDVTGSVKIVNRAILVHRDLI